MNPNFNIHYAAGIKSQEISQHYQEPIGAETPQGVIADGTAISGATWQSR